MGNVWVVNHNPRRHNTVLFNMGIFDHQIQFIQDVEKALFTEMEMTINRHDTLLEDMITGSQLWDRGIDGDGEKLPGYARTTIRLKIRKGLPYDRTTLFDEGEFHPSITVTGTPYYIAITSDVPHAKWLVRRYGEQIMSITIENFSRFFYEYYIPNLKKNVDSKFTR